jgi:uncharacterized membrane protein YczE
MEMKAKTTSHIGMIVGAVSLLIVFIVVILKFFFKDSSLTIEQAFSLIIIGIAPSIPFCPIYISTWLDKWYEIKNGKKETE